jgi:hypothetical protein
MGAPFLVERGIDPSEEGLGAALIMRLLLDLPEDDSYFRSLAVQPTMAQALWTTLQELRMARVRATQILPETFASPASTRSSARWCQRTRHFLPLRSAGTWLLSTRRRCSIRNLLSTPPTDLTERGYKIFFCHAFLWALLRAICSHESRRFR